MPCGRVCHTDTGPIRPDRSFPVGWLGPSWDYRLIFLLLAVPFGLSLARSSRPGLLALVFLVLWIPRLEPIGSLADIGGPVAQLALAVAPGTLVMSRLVDGVGATLGARPSAIG